MRPTFFAVVLAVVLWSVQGLGLAESCNLPPWSGRKIAADSVKPRGSVSQPCCERCAVGRSKMSAERQDLAALRSFLGETFAKPVYRLVQKTSCSLQAFAVRQLALENWQVFDNPWIWPWRPGLESVRLGFRDITFIVQEFDFKLGEPLRPLLDSGWTTHDDSETHS